MDTTIRGIFEVRSYPNTEPEHMRRRFGHADVTFHDRWYIVIDNGGGVDDPWQWGYGVSWYHPDDTLHGTFDQKLVPVDDAAREIFAFVKSKHVVTDAAG